MSLVTGIVPILNEMPAKIFDRVATNPESYIMPREPRLGSFNIFLPIVLDINKIINPAVIELDPRIIDR